ncbi:MAG: GIY-YIG nuclease family protein [Candidatus Latescibacterota bacterium]|jgi:putative endonuclease
MSAGWSLYLIRCNDDTLYTGIAVDVVRRFGDHAAQGRRCARYLRGRGPLRLAFAVEVGTRSRAAQIEARVKRLSRADKERLVRGELGLNEVAGS